ncbi:MAG: hypothetical protein ACOY0T_29070 [Myxococcota bacterium]
MQLATCFLPNRAAAQADVAEPARQNPTNPANPTVVLVDPEGSALARRLQQELEALGFDVQIRSENPKRALAEELREPHAIAAIEIRPARSGQVDLVIVGARSPDLIHQSLPIEARQDPASAELVATRTVELLRAARLELQAAREGQSAPVHRQARAELVASEAAGMERRASKAVLTGGFALASSPPFGLGTAGWVSAGWHMHEHWSLLAEISRPVSAGTLRRSEGAVDVSMNSYRAGSWLESLRSRRFSAGVGVGAQLEHVWLRGYAEQPYLSQASRRWTWGPWLRAGGALRLNTNLRVLATFTLGWSLPDTTVRFAGREITRVGQPSLNAALGLEWSP